MIDNDVDAMAWLRKQLDGDDNDLLREMVAEFAARLMAAEEDTLVGAGWGEHSTERVNYATAIGTGGGARGSARSTSPSRSCVGTATSRTGCRTRAVAPRRPWSRSWPSAACGACPPGGSTGWSRPDADNVAYTTTRGMTLGSFDREARLGLARGATAAARVDQDPALAESPESQK